MTPTGHRQTNIWGNKAAVQPAPNESPALQAFRRVQQTGVSQSGDATGKPKPLPKSNLPRIWCGQQSQAVGCLRVTEFTLSVAKGVPDVEMRGALGLNAKLPGPARDLPAAKCKADTAAQGSHLSNYMKTANSSYETDWGSLGNTPA